MSRFLAGLALGALIFAGAVGAKVVGVTNPMGTDLDGGGYSIGNVGDIYARSVQATGPTISNLSEARADRLTAPRIEITNGGNGFGWNDVAGVPVTRIMAGDFGASGLPPIPASSLVLERNSDGTATLWFKTCPDVSCWVRVAG